MLTLACMLPKWEMSSFSLLSMSMISSWCEIIRTSLCKWKENFLEGLKWKILEIHICSWAWMWKGIMNKVFFTSTKLVFQGDFQVFSHGGLQSHWNAIWSQGQVEKEYEQRCWNGWGSLSISCWIFYVCHVVAYSTELGIPNKHGESTHGQSKLGISLCPIMSWKWQSHICKLFNGGHGGGCTNQGIVKRTT